jgi:hypothetical protein
VDLDRTGQPEDPKHSRHWNHSPSHSESCRYCLLKQLIERTRPELDWLSQKPGGLWPIVLAVPVEMIESWLLMARAIVTPGSGMLRAENSSRASQKHAFYGKPVPTKEDVEKVALPVIRQLTPLQLQTMATHSRSFALFTAEIDACRQAIVGPRDCWQAWDQGAER